MMAFPQHNSVEKKMLDAWLTFHRAAGSLLCTGSGDAAAVCSWVQKKLCNIPMFASNTRWFPQTAMQP